METRLRRAFFCPFSLSRHFDVLHAPYMTPLLGSDPMARTTGYIVPEPTTCWYYDY